MNLIKLIFFWLAALAIIPAQSMNQETCLADTATAIPIAKLNTLFLEEAWRGTIEKCKQLLSQGAQPNTTDENGNTALILAYILDRKDMCSFLSPLVNGNAKNHTGSTALCMAALDGNIEFWEILIPYTNKETKQQALDRAIFAGHANVCELLVNRYQSRQDLNLEALDDTGITPLILAAQRGHANVVAVLASHVDVNKKARRELSALLWAAQNGNTDVCITLARLKECDSDLADDDGLTPLMWTVKEGHIETCKALLPFCNANAVDKRGRTALIRAAKKGHLEMCKALAPFSDVNATDANGRTALMWVAAQKNPENSINICLTLLDHSARLDIADIEGNTALIWAALKGNVALCQAMVDHVKAIRKNTLTLLCCLKKLSLKPEEGQESVFKKMGLKPEEDKEIEFREMGLKPKGECESSSDALEVSHNATLKKSLNTALQDYRTSAREAYRIMYSCQAALPKPLIKLLEMENKSERTAFNYLTIAVLNPDLLRTQKENEELLKVQRAAEKKEKLWRTVSFACKILVAAIMSGLLIKKFIKPLLSKIVKSIGLHALKLKLGFRDSVIFDKQ